MYYSIGEISKLLGVQTHTIRFWEKEFAILSPNRKESGRRVYTEKELRILQEIKYLLYEEGFTTKGAMKEIQKRYAEFTSGQGDAKLEEENFASHAPKNTPTHPEALESSPQISLAQAERNILHIKQQKESSSSLERNHFLEREKLHLQKKQNTEYYQKLISSLDNLIRMWEGTKLDE